MAYSQINQWKSQTGYEYTVFYVVSWKAAGTRGKLVVAFPRGDEVKETNRKEPGRRNLGHCGYKEYKAVRAKSFWQKQVREMWRTWKSRTKTRFQFRKHPQMAFLGTLRHYLFSFPMSYLDYRSKEPPCKLLNVLCFFPLLPPGLSSTNWWAINQYLASDTFREAVTKICVSFLFSERWRLSGKNPHYYFLLELGPVLHKIQENQQLPWKGWINQNTCI